MYSIKNIGNKLVARGVKNILPVLLLFLCAHVAYANEQAGEIQSEQEGYEVVAIKNNLLYDAAATPNLSLEVRLARRWTLDMGVGFNPFPLSDEKFPKWRHLSVSLAPRYWFCGAFNRGFISFNAAYAMYNVAGDSYVLGWMYPQVKEHRYFGHAAMGGVSAGWHFAFSPHFSIELEGGVDAGYSWYDEYECKHCGTKTNNGGRWLVLPKVGINLAVVLGGNKASLAKRCDCEKLEEVREVQEVPADTIEPREVIAPLLAVIDSVPVTGENPREAFVPVFEPQVDQMSRLRNRLLRSEDEYEPYNPNMALSADPRNVFLYFDVNVTKMDRNFIENDKLMDSIMYILGEAVADTTLRITHIQVVGYASFDGRQSYNEKLAGSRAQTIKEYIQSVYPLPDSVFAVCNGGESWAELRYQLNKVEFDGKEGVIRIIDETADPDLREKQIKQYRNGGTYRYMKDRLKKILRNLGCITIYYENVE